MYIKQLYTGCLSEAAYYIESDGEAAVIDPLRDIETYIELANSRNAQIKYVFETHFHADFVSGHIDLAKQTGAQIVYGPNTQTNLPVLVAADGEVFEIGKLKIQVLHTPGHTLESSCYLLYDEEQNEHCVFTGDTLFIGDVGRPDLAQKDMELTTNDLAGMLYYSLRNKLMPLPDEVIVYPAHGAGSSCGKNLSKETQSTIGMQKQANYAFQENQTKEEFIQAVTTGITPPPKYFAINAMLNKNGYEDISVLLEKALQPLNVAAFKALMAQHSDLIIVDSRLATEFTQGFIPTSISIGLEGRFAEWAGAILPFDKPIVLVTEAGKEKETATRLARVGFEQIVGFLQGGFEAWQQAKEPIDIIIDIEADEMAMDLNYDHHAVVIDVRKESEYELEHVKDAVNLPVEKLTDPGELSDMEDGLNFYIHCAGGYRSVIAASLLKRQDIHNIRNVLGGYNAIKQFADKLPLVKEAPASK